MAVSHVINPKLSTQVFDCRRPFSFFDLLEQLAKDTNAEIPLHRACSLMRKDQIHRSFRAQGGDAPVAEEAPLTVVVEGEANTELQNEYKNEFERENEVLGKILREKVTSKPTRISFFESHFDDPNSVSSQDNSVFLGYLTIKRNICGNYMFGNVHEAVLKHRALPNNYVHCSKAFTSNCCGRSFTVKGCLYCQQNALSNVCLTACLKMLLNTLGVNHGSKITCEDLSSFMNIAPEEIQEGIEIDQVYAVLKRYGLCYRHWDFIKRPQENFADFIHSAIESGGAAMVSFYCRNRAGQLSAHIVPVFGHTLNSDAWYSQARKAYGQRLPSYEWYNTTDWVPHFIVHDDNFGMYYCMEVSRMQPQIGPQEKLGKTDLQKIPEMVAGICIGVYPKSSWTDRQVYEVQGLAIAAIRYLFESARQAEILEDLRAVQPPWFDRLYKSFDPIEPVNFPVLRSFLISRAKYEEHLAKDDWERNPLDPQQKSDILASLPDQFWMVELSLPDLFTANKRKLGEVLLRTSGAYKRLSPDSGVIGVRLPSVYFRLGGARPKFFLLRTRSHLPMLKLDEQVEEL